MFTSGSQGARKVSQQEMLIGRTFQKGEYVVEAVLGHGATGQVFRASHTQTDVSVALKQVRADEPLPASVIEELDQRLHHKDAITQPSQQDFPFSGGANTDRFLREALLLARLRHPALPLLYDYFLENGHWYLVTEYVSGSPLSTHIREHAPLAPLEAINYALQICNVLDYLHKLNPPVIFHNLKPTDIILCPDGRLMIVDLGFACSPQEGPHNDTANFGSPEEYEETSQTDTRSDLLSLGLIMHEMLSGQRPTRRDVSLQQLETLHKLNPSLSPVLSGLVKVATRTEPLYRFQSAHTFYQALERAYAVEERRFYRSHTLIADISTMQQTPKPSMFIPLPSSQGFLRSEPTQAENQHTQHIHMREQTPHNTSNKNAEEEQETLSHQLTALNETLKMHTRSLPLTTHSAPRPVVMPTYNLNSPQIKAETPTAPTTPPTLPPTPSLPLQQSKPRKPGKARLILLCLLILLITGLLLYHYLTPHT
jgi:serine/threonine protein kinase